MWFLKELELICLHMSIAIISTKLNGCNYFYLTPIIVFSINHLFTHRVEWLQVLLFKTNSIQHNSLICKQLNSSKNYYVIPIIQFRHSVKEFQVLLFNTTNSIISHLFTYSLNVKQFYLTHRSDPIRHYHSGLEWTWEKWQLRGTPHTPKLHNWHFTIRLFSVISRTFVDKRSYSSAEIQSMYSTTPANWAVELWRM